MGEKKTNFDQKLQNKAAIDKVLWKLLSKKVFTIRHEFCTQEYKRHSCCSFLFSSKNTGIGLEKF